MSKLRRADYSKDLRGKTITRCEWANDTTESFRCLSLYFDDETLCTFRFYLGLDEEAEMQTFKDGNISNESPMTPLPIRLKVEPLEP